MCKNNCKSRCFSGNEEGYTLMELLIVVFILVSLSGAMLLNSSGAKEQARLTSAVDVVESTLINTQAIGMNGKPFPEDATRDNPEAFDKGYGVYIEKDETHIMVYGGQGDIDDSGGIDPNEEKYNGSSQDYEMVMLPARVTIDSVEITNASGNFVQSNNGANVLFRRGSVQAHIHRRTGFDNADRIKIVLKSGDMEAVVYVIKTGLIYHE